MPVISSTIIIIFLLTVISRIIITNTSSASIVQGPLNDYILVRLLTLYQADEVLALLLLTMSADVYSYCMRQHT